jgi:hypothetical protein
LRARCRLVAVEIGHEIPRAEYCEVDLNSMTNMAKIDIKLGAPTYWPYVSAQQLKPLKRSKLTVVAAGRDERLASVFYRPCQRTSQTASGRSQLH